MSKSLISLLCLAVGLFASSIVWAQTERRDLEASLGVDMTQSLPQQGTVNAVYPADSEIRIDGVTYRLITQDDSAVTADSKSGGLSIRDLRPGMTVMIETDGTEPSSRHKPYILRIWSE